MPDAPAILWPRRRARNGFFEQQRRIVGVRRNEIAVPARVLVIRDVDLVRSDVENRHGVVVILLEVPLIRRKVQLPHFRRIADGRKLYLIGVFAGRFLVGAAADQPALAQSELAILEDDEIVLVATIPGGDAIEI